MDNNNFIFAQAKVEYTKQLIDTIKENIFDKFMKIYNESKETLYNKKDIILKFRENLENVPNWNQTFVDEEAHNIIKCDYLEDLITAVYLTHTKILLSVGKKNPDKKIDLIIPKTNTFIHKCLISIARELWKNPYLFNSDIDATDYQRNINSIESIICEGIEHTIRSTLPVKNILKEQLESTYINEKQYNEGYESEEEELNQTNTINKEEEIQPINHRINEPSEFQILKNTQDLQINDDLLTTNTNKEEIYDNPYIFSKTNDQTTENEHYLNYEKNKTEYYGNNIKQNTNQDKIMTEVITIDSNLDKETLNDTHIHSPIINDQLQKEQEVRSEQEVQSEQVKSNSIQNDAITLESIQQQPTIKPEIDYVNNNLYGSSLLKSNSETNNEKKIKIDTDDTDTLDNFFDDLKQMTTKTNNEDSLF